MNTDIEKNIKHNLFSSLKATDYLLHLDTDLGRKNIYDAACQCNRCGYCYEHCPSYLTIRRENYSARGRAQLVKMIIEWKIDPKKDYKEVYEALSSCLVCGACMSACYGKVAVHKIVTQARLPFIDKKISTHAKIILKLLLEKPKKFSLILKIVNLIRITGIFAALSKIGFFKFTGLSWIYNAHKIMGRPNFKVFKSFSKKNSALEKYKNTKPDCIYFVSCVANYLKPKIASSTLSLLEKYAGCTKIMAGPCCGAIQFTYCGTKNTKENAKKIIKLYEKQCGGKEIMLATDCSSCSYHLKNYPELFSEERIWHERASNFSKNVRDITEIANDSNFQNGSWQKNTRVTCHHSSCAYHKQSIDLAETIKKISGGGFTPAQQSTVACGGELGFNFVNPEIAGTLLKRKIADIARTQSDFVITSDGLSLLFIEYGLKRYYPLTRALHFSVFADSAGLKK
jgi:glycolate oxidase iron-sulfur subunit